jgi:hypothetical protein
MGGEVNGDDIFGEPSSDCTDYCLAASSGTLAGDASLLYVTVCGFADACPPFPRPLF